MELFSLWEERKEANMAVDYTVNFRSRLLGTNTIINHQFGNEFSSYLTHITPRQDAGVNHAYSFDTPNVDPSLDAILMFQTIDVRNEENILEINGIRIPNAIRANNPNAVTIPPESRPTTNWSGNVVIIQPNILNETDNTLIIRSAGDDDPDDFIISDVVLIYKTRERDDSGRELTVSATATVRG